MKRGSILSLTWILLMSMFIVAFAQEVKTIKGEVIDISCYVTAGAKGEDHKTCALACIKAGEPAGILEEGTGKVYLIITSDHMTNPSEKILPFVAKTVEATGTIAEKSGISTIDIKDIKEPKAMPMDMEGMQNKESMGY